MNWGAVTAVIVGASRCAAWLLRRIDRHAGKAIAGHIDAALANSAAWLVDSCADCAADCLDCIGDGSHDSLVLDRNEEFAWREIELGYDRSTP